MATITGTPGNDDLKGVNGEPNDIVGGLGDDNLTGGANSTDNQLYGDDHEIAGTQDLVAGNDTLIGGANSTNTLYGDAGSTNGNPNFGNDVLIGGKGGENFLIGDSNDHSGVFTGGNDRLVSAEKTTDHMWGDLVVGGGGPFEGGRDVFAFAKHNGDDFIYDFEQGTDIIELDLGKNDAFSDLNIEVVASDSVIHFDANDSITVANVTALTADDFMFV